MGAVPLGITPYRRRDARTPEVALVNMLIEKDQTNLVDGYLRFQRPGLGVFATAGDGPTRAVFRRLGVINSLYYVVSGPALYSVHPTTKEVRNLGFISGDDICSVDGSATRLIIVADGVAYSWNGTALSTIVVPDIDGVTSLISSVIYIAGYFILTVKDSQHYFWLAPGDTNPDALNFASAESAPDNLVKAAKLLDELWLFGEQTTEVWQLTGNADAPFVPIGGRLYEKGCASRDTVATLDNTLFWVSNELIAYRADTAPVRISDHSIEERLRDGEAENLRAWAFQMDGHTLYALRCGDIGTYCYDVENQNWPRFKTYGQETWRAHLGCQTDGDQIIAGDDTDGTLWAFDHTRSNDGGVVLERELTGGVPIIGAPVKNSSLSLRTATGWAPITGTATDPVVQMRFSDDGGNLWSTWIEAPMGLQGQYYTEVVWRQLGLMRQPGRLYQIRCTDDAIFRASYCRFNEAQSIG